MTTNNGRRGHRYTDPIANESSSQINGDISRNHSDLCQNAGTIHQNYGNTYYGNTYYFYDQISQTSRSHARLNAMLLAVAASERTLPLALLHEIDVNLYTDERLSATGVRLGHIQLLLCVGAGTDARDAVGATPLYHAVCFNDLLLAALLLRNRANVDRVEGPSGTVLHVAFLRGEPEMMQLLLNRGGCFEGRRNGRGLTPLMLAAERGDPNIVQMLLDNGADVEARGPSQQTPLMSAIKGGHTDVVRILLEKGVNVEAKDSGHDTALLLAIRYKRADMVRMLLEKVVNLEARDSHSDTPLLLAIRLGLADVVQMLLDKSVDSEARDLQFLTPLLLATRLGLSDIARTLIGKGASIEAKDSVDQAAPEPAADSTSEDVAHDVGGQARTKA